MGKSKLTKDIETALIRRFYGTTQRFALEVPFGGIVDGMTAQYQYYTDEKMIITPYEIKISLSDFKSKNGHNLFGNYNYYVIPVELLNKIKPLVKDHIGIMVYTERGSLRIVKDSKYQEMNIESKLRALDQMLMVWNTGSMVAEFKRKGFDFKNDVMKCPSCGEMQKVSGFYKGECNSCFWKKEKLRVKEIKKKNGVF